MSQYLNVGLQKNSGSKEFNSVHDTIAVCRQVGIIAGTYSVKNSDTEPTVVIQLEVPAKQSTLHELSIRLEQDCVAFYDDETKHGSLIGPKAEEWGAFNEAFFLFPD
jgi:hypothetical protein